MDGAVSLWVDSPDNSDWVFRSAHGSPQWESGGMEMYNPIQMAEVECAV